MLELVCSEHVPYCSASLHEASVSAGACSRLSVALRCKSNWERHTLRQVFSFQFGIDARGIQAAIMNNCMKHTFHLARQ